MFKKNMEKYISFLIKIVFFGLKKGRDRLYFIIFYLAIFALFFSAYFYESWNNNNIFTNPNLIKVVTLSLIGIIASTISAILLYLLDRLRVENEKEKEQNLFKKLFGLSNKENLEKDRNTDIVLPEFNIADTKDNRPDTIHDFAALADIKGVSKLISSTFGKLQLNHPEIVIADENYINNYRERHSNLICIGLFTNKLLRVPIIEEKCKILFSLEPSQDSQPSKILIDPNHSKDSYAKRDESNYAIMARVKINTRYLVIIGGLTGNSTEGICHHIAEKWQEIIKDARDRRPENKAYELTDPRTIFLILFEIPQGKEPYIKDVIACQENEPK